MSSFLYFFMILLFTILYFSPFFFFFGVRSTVFMFYLSDCLYLQITNKIRYTYNKGWGKEGYIQYVLFETMLGKCCRGD